MDYSFLVGIHYHRSPDDQPMMPRAERGGGGGASSMVSPATDGGGGGMSFIGASPKMARTVGQEWRTAGDVTEGLHGGGTFNEGGVAQSAVLPPGRKGPHQPLGAASYESFTEFQGGMLSNPLRAPMSGAPSSTAINGGPGKHSHEIYYVGIIDILQEYNWWKRGETIIRRATNDVQQVSSVDPHLYNTRFVSFMSSIIT